MDPSPYELILTAPTTADVRSLVDKLVDDGLCAGVHIDTIETTYRWAGEVQHGSEHRLTIHASSLRLDELHTRLRSWHPYEVPCITVRPLDGTPDYLDWVRTNGGSSEQAGPPSAGSR